LQTIGAVDNVFFRSGTIRIFRLLHRHRGVGSDGLQHFFNGSFQLRITAARHETGVIDDRDVRVHPITFDDPFALRIVDAERGDGDAAAIDQRGRAGDAD
jgi:hypothetical protein